MHRYLWRELRAQRARACVLGAGVLVAAVSFVLLAGASRTSELRVRSTLAATYRTAYDIYVRPKNATTQLERSEGLVQDNFLSGIYGGITLSQWRSIEGIRGVAVAAPIANLGYLFFPGYATVSIKKFIDREPQQLYRVREGYLADNGLSLYPPVGADYEYHHRRPLKGKYASVICGGFHPPRSNGAIGLAGTGPFDPALSTTLGCGASPGQLDSPAPGATQSGFASYFPVKLAAIDPKQEALLLNLNKTVTSGRYLREGEGTTRGLNAMYVPVLASDRTFLKEEVVTSVQRLSVPKGVNVPRTLASGACTGEFRPCPKAEVVPPPTNSRWKNGYEFLTSLPGQAVGRETRNASATYAAALSGNNVFGKLFISAYWTDSPVKYRVLGQDHLQPEAVTNSPSIWRDEVGPAHDWITPPSDNRDIQFRALHEVRGLNQFNLSGVAATPVLHLVGEFDPDKLPGFSPLTKVPLETYYPPELEPANRQSRRALGGRPLLPSQNLGGYIQQPPLLLTTIQAFQAFLSNKSFVGVPAELRRAPIAAIRVRVRGVTGFNALSEARIRLVAQAIHDRTGLQVDITAGSSPHPVLISLPKGRFGRPSLLLREGWSKKGVSLSFVRALDRKDVALFALILVVCALFLGNGSFAAVRARRVELGTLATVGWSRGELAKAVVGELATVGLLSGILGVAVATSIVSSFHLSFPLVDTLYVLPIATVLATVAGLPAAWTAARGHPMQAILPPVTSSRNTRHVRGVVGFAIANLRRLPGRTLAGGAGLVLGVAALAVLVAIERDFQGALVGTVLGTAVSIQVHGADFVALALTVGLAASSTADVLYINLRERRAELATLRTVGWSNGETRRLLGTEAALLAVGASGVGGVLGAAFGALVLGVAARPLVVAALIAGAGAAGTALVASTLPLVRWARLAAPEVLAAE